MSAGVVAAHYVDGGSGGGATGYAAAILADAPIAYWRLEETAAPYADASGNSKTLTPVGTVSRVAAGAVTSSTASLAVNDTAAYLDSNVTLSSVSAFTVELWFRTPTGDAVGAFASCRPSTGGHSFTLSMGNDPFGNTANARVGFGLDGSGVYLGAKGTGIWNDGNWHHLVGTWQGSSGAAVTVSQFAVYVDGVQDNGGTTGGGSATAPISSNGQGYRLGAPAPGGWGGGGMRADLDEIAFYDKALTASQVAAHYAARTT